MYRSPNIAPTCFLNRKQHPPQKKKCHPTPRNRALKQTVIRVNMFDSKLYTPEVENIESPFPSLQKHTKTIHGFTVGPLLNFGDIPITQQKAGIIPGQPPFISHLSRPLGRGPTTRSLGDLGSPWLSTTYESCEDPPIL